MKCLKAEEFIKRTASVIKTKLLIQEVQVSTDNAKDSVPNIKNCLIQTRVVSLGFTMKMRICTQSRNVDVYIFIYLIQNILL